MAVENNMGYRLLRMYDVIMRGEPLQKRLLMEQFGVTAKTFQRDLEELRGYIADIGGGEIRYNKAKNAYFLVKSDSAFLSQQEVLGLCGSCQASSSSSRCSVSAMHVTTAPSALIA